MAKALANDLGSALCEALELGDPNMVRRIVIDVKSGHAAIVHVEYCVDNKTIDVIRQIDGVKVEYHDRKENEVTNDG